MELKELEAALEGVLFAAGEPVGVERLCLGLEVDRATMDAVAQRLMDRYSYERRGIRLVRLDTSYLGTPDAPSVPDHNSENGHTHMLRISPALSHCPVKWFRRGRWLPPC